MSDHTPAVPTWLERPLAEAMVIDLKSTMALRGRVAENPHLKPVCDEFANACWEWIDTYGDELLAALAKAEEA